jgi:hypothetical protein
MYDKQKASRQHHTCNVRAVIVVNSCYSGIDAPKSSKELIVDSGDKRRIQPAQCQQTQQGVH